MPKQITYANMKFSSARAACQYFNLREQRFSAFSRRWFGSWLWNHGDYSEQFTLFLECWNSGEFVYQERKYINLWKFLYLNKIYWQGYIEIRRLYPDWCDYDTLTRVELLMRHHRE
jgi:hypothetical protein